MWPSRRVELASSPLPTVRELDTQAQNYFSRSEPNFFDLLHSSWAQKHCSTYKLVWKSMKLNREICIIAHRAITERVALLGSGILLFKAYEGKMAIRPAAWLVGMKKLLYLQISMK